MKPIIDIAAWDIVETSDGGIVVILPPSPRPRCLIAALDALYVGTAAATLRLVHSAHLAGLAVRAPHVVVAEADDMIRRETLVDVRIANTAFGPIGEANDPTDRRIAA